MEEEYSNYNKLFNQKRELFHIQDDVLERIRECDSKISYYKWCIERCLFLINVNKKHIETYNRINKYSKRNKSLFSYPDFYSQSTDDYVSNRIIDFQSEIAKLYKDRDFFKKPLQLYIALKKALEIKNAELSKEIELIDDEINNIEDKSYSSDNKVLKKGEIKND